ncbi:thiamine phosphate synthase [Anaeroselena agilis]|uniref:Thiamine phosphate synthase n=1 Tax=Anaeroselena agilis TaxID=3063788 RepID=A0ABU3P4J1_9FIRM|nr:thiamine phosphate synthase [Selenomonadales bacterium 4137-cl]
MLICVTDRRLCPAEDFLPRIERLAAAKPYAVMLREKDLDPPAYARLARQVKDICDRHGVLLIGHQNPTVAEQMAITHLQLPLPALRAYRRRGPLLIGASVHSAAEAEEAQSLGAAYLVAGHIFATDSKKGVPPKGLPFLRQICQAVNLPVYAIGGISASNAPAVLECGAAGFCVLSAAMTCPDPAAFVRAFDRLR